MSVKKKTLECRPDPMRCTVCLTCPHFAPDVYCYTNCKQKVRSKDGILWCKENGDALYPREYFEQDR